MSENCMDIKIAIKYAKDYCIDKGYDPSILEKLKYNKGSYICAFVKDKDLDYKPDLTTDIESMPYFFLGVKNDGTVVEGPDTHLFLEGKIEL
ncbi:MAG: hypothetical protein SPI49_06305 [Eubacteriales bacterium]|nr:hypothetical protein [Eubacteriales bacterium]